MLAASAGVTHGRRAEREVGWLSRRAYTLSIVLSQGAAHSALACQGCAGGERRRQAGVAEGVRSPQTERQERRGNHRALLARGAGGEGEGRLLMERLTAMGYADEVVQWGASKLGDSIDSKIALRTRDRGELDPPVGQPTQEQPKAAQGARHVVNPVDSTGRPGAENGIGRADGPLRGSSRPRGARFLTPSREPSSFTSNPRRRQGLGLAEEGRAGAVRRRADARGRCEAGGGGDGDAGRIQLTQVFSQGTLLL